MAAKKKKPQKTTIWTWTHIQLSIYLLAISFVLTCVICTILFIFVSLNIPDISSLASYQPAATTVILDRHGNQIDRIFTQNRFVVPLEKMPKALPQAFVAAEDARFFQHGGVDVWSIARALVHNLRKGGKGQGGSTITQQVARALLLTPEKTYTRKLKEAILAYRIDKVLSKEEILHIYLNQIYFGEGAYGVDAAARIYFGKQVFDLNLAEISILAGLPQAPSRYSPFKNFNLCKKRQVYVLNRMAEEGFITPTMARKAHKTPLLWGAPHDSGEDSRFFSQYIKNYIRSQYGQDMLQSGGLTIKTTLDPLLQKSANAAVNRGVAQWVVRRTKKSSKLPQAALVAMEGSSGKVRALVGGTNFLQSQFNRATQAKRQPGSAFKPFVYAASFQHGFHSASLIDDAPLNLPGSSSANSWQPRNFSGEFYGATTLHQALTHSRNIVAIKLLQQIGIDAVRDFSKQLGIRSPLGKNLSLALGASEMTLLELTGAYTAFANMGNVQKPVFITEIIDRNGITLEKYRPHTNQVIAKETAFQMTYLMQKVIEDGTGKKAWGLPQQSAGKTGTTDRNRDAWFIGYTPEMVCGVWMGFDRRHSLGRGETGGRTCAPVWLDFMKQVPYQKKTFSVPPKVVFLPVDQESGKFNPTNRDKSSWMVFSKDNLPWTDSELTEQDAGQ